MADQEQISSGGFSKTTNFKWLAVGSSFISWAVISLHMEEIAQQINSTPYVLSTGIHRRTERIYLT